MRGQVDRSGHRSSQQAHRERRHADGYREVFFWLHKDVRQLINQSIEDGHFRSQAEAIGVAIQNFFVRKEGRGGHQESPRRRNVKPM